MNTATNNRLEAHRDWVRAKKVIEEMKEQVKILTSGQVELEIQIVAGDEFFELATDDGYMVYSLHSE